VYRGRVNFIAATETGPNYHARPSERRSSRERSGLLRAPSAAAWPDSCSSVLSFVCGDAHENGHVVGGGCFGRRDVLGPGTPD
jgi:hypothetical protein